MLGTVGHGGRHAPHSFGRDNTMSQLYTYLEQNPNPRRPQSYFRHLF